MATLKKYLPCAPGHRSHHGEQQTFYMKFVNLIVSSWLPVIAKCGLTVISGFESAVLQPDKMDGSAQSESGPASTREERGLGVGKRLECFPSPAWPARAAPDVMHGTGRGAHTE